MGEGMIGELAFIHLDSHVVQKCLAGQQKHYRDKASKGNALSLSYPSAFYAPYQDVFVPRDRPASRVYIP